MSDDAGRDAALLAAIDRLASEVHSLRNELVRKDVYGADKLTFANQFAALDRANQEQERRHGKEIADLERKVDKDIDDRKADRRLIIAAFLALVAQIIVQVYQQAQGAA